MTKIKYVYWVVPSYLKLVWQGGWSHKSFATFATWHLKHSF